MRAAALLAALLAGVPAAGASHAPRISSVRLPGGATFYAVEPAGRRLVISGSATAGPACVWVTADPATLRLGPPHRGRCEPAALAAHPVAPALFRDLRSSKVR